jgi:hypothetical protein
MEATPTQARSSRIMQDGMQSWTGWPGQSSGGSSSEAARDDEDRVGSGEGGDSGATGNGAGCDSLIEVLEVGIFIYSPS